MSCMVPPYPNGGNLQSCVTRPCHRRKERTIWCGGCRVQVARYVSASAHYSATAPATLPVGPELHLRLVDRPRCSYWAASLRCARSCRASNRGMPPLAVNTRRLPFATLAAAGARFSVLYLAQPPFRPDPRCRVPFTVEMRKSRASRWSPAQHLRISKP